MHNKIRMSPAGYNQNFSRCRSNTEQRLLHRNSVPRFSSEKYQNQLFNGVQEILMIQNYENHTFELFISSAKHAINPSSNDPTTAP